MTDALKLSYGVAKRSFTIAVVIATIAWSVAATFAIAPAAHAAVSGDLVKGSLPAVYYVGSDGKRYVFTNDKAYFTWYTDFSAVKKISDTDLAAIMIGGNVTYKPGVRMVKIQSDPKVYAVGHGGVLHWVSTEAAAAALYGSNWNTKIDDISDAFFVNYTVGSQITTASDFNITAEQNNSTSINADKGLAGGGALNATLASDNPSGSTLTCNAAGVNFLKVNFSGTGTISGLVFHRVGAGTASDFSNVYLYDGDTRLTVGRSVTSSDSSVTFSNLNVVVSGSKEITLVADLAGLTGGNCAPDAGNSNAFAINAATDITTNTTIGGTFPLTGSAFSIAASKSGSLTVAAGSTPSDPKVGQQGVELANFKISAGSAEDVVLRRIILTNSGSAQLANLANLKLMDAGTTVAQNPIVSGSTATFVLAVPYTLGKGIQRTFSLVGDVLAANRPNVDTIQFYVDQTYDVYATGATYGLGVNVTDNFTTGSILHIQGGQITYAFNGPTTSDLSVGSNDATLLKFAITAANNIEVKNTNLALHFSAPIANDIVNITDIKIKNADTGVVVAGPFDLTQWNTGNTLCGTSPITGVPSLTNQDFCKLFTDRYDVNSGQTVNYAVTFDVLTSATNALPGVSVKAALGARVAGDIRNLDSNLNVDPTTVVPLSALTGNPQTIRASGMTIGLASSPSSATVTKGSSVNSVGFNFTAGSASDVTVTQVKLKAMADILGGTAFAISTGGHPVADIVQSVSIWDGTTQLGTSTSPDTNGMLNFSNLSWVVPAGTTKTLTAQVTTSNNTPYANPANSFIIDITGTGTDSTTPNIVATDKDSNTVTVTSPAWATDVRLNQSSVYDTVISSGTMSIRLDGDTPVSAIVTANTTDNSVTRIKFTSVNEAFLVTRLTVENDDAVSCPGVNCSSRSITSVRLFDKDGNLFCSGALDSNNRLRCAQDAGLFTVNGQHTITAKISLAIEGSGTTGANSGDAPVLGLVVDKTGHPATDPYSDDIKVVGVSSGTAMTDGDALNATGPLSIVDNVGTSGILKVDGNLAVVRKTQPTITAVALPTTTLSNQESTIAQIAVTAASGADVAIKRMTFKDSVNSALGHINTLRLYENGTLLDTAKYAISDAYVAGSDLKGGADIGVTPLIVVTFTTESAVSAGSTKTYALKATSIAGTANGDSMSVFLADDTGPGINHDTAANVIATSSNLVWSDNSADNHDPAVSADFTNGYLVKTLPTNPQSLSR
jgi:hypothetical protein